VLDKVTHAVQSVVKFKSNQCRLLIGSSNVDLPVGGTVSHNNRAIAVAINLFTGVAIKCSSASSITSFAGNVTSRNIGRRKLANRPSLTFVRRLLISLSADDYDGQSERRLGVEPEMTADDVIGHAGSRDCGGVSQQNLVAAVQASYDSCAVDGRRRRSVVQVGGGGGASPTVVHPTTPDVWRRRPRPTARPRSSAVTAAAARRRRPAGCGDVGSGGLMMDDPRPTGSLRHENIRQRGGRRTCR